MVYPGIYLLFFPLLLYMTQITEESIINDMIDNDLDYLNRRLYGDAMTYMYKHIHHVDGITAHIKSVDELIMVRLKKETNHYINRHILFNNIIKIDNLCHYNEQRDTLMDKLRIDFCNYIDQNYHHNAIYFELIYDKKTKEIHISLILYEQTVENMINEMIKELETLKDAPISKIKSYLWQKSIMFDQLDICKINTG